MIKKSHTGIRICLVFILFLLSTEQSEAQTRFHVAFFSPGTPEDLFWQPVECFMRAACNDLEINLSVFYANRNHRKSIEQFRNLAESNRKPDFAVFQNHKMNGIEMLHIAEASHVPSFIFNSSLTESQRKKTGGPRGKMSFWIGEMVPDDQLAGFQLLNLLVSAARKKGFEDASGNISVIPINGAMRDIAALERGKGLKKACSNDPHINLHTVTFGNWKRDHAETIFLRFMRKYPDSRVVWAANDDIALGVIDGILKQTERPSVDRIVGGMDWSIQGLRAIQKGKMTVSMGGHFMEGGWVMVLLYDYFHGIDFKDRGVSMKSQLSPITKENVDFFLEHFGSGKWDKIDFRKFSKKYNPSLKTYNFTVDAISRQLGN